MPVVIMENGRVPVKCWTEGVELEESARAQLRNVAALPFIHRHVAVMPDVHWGMGATIGSVIPTHGAIVPAAVGVDLGCGMVAQPLNLMASALPDSLRSVRAAIEAAIPHGRSAGGDPTKDKGAWNGGVPADVSYAWRLKPMGTKPSLDERHRELVEQHPALQRGTALPHLGTLGTGNHFVEVCIDEQQRVWLMLHSGSRGVGNRIASHFIALARKEMERWFIHLPDADLAYLPEGSEHFWDYVRAVRWAQDFAAINRRVMLLRALRAVEDTLGLTDLADAPAVINCHHNYVEKERHYGADVWVTRKGAVRAGVGDMGIIPGSMGAKSYIVRGLGNRESFYSCSHGAGRRMSRSEARRRFTVADHIAATAGIECRKDEGVLDETRDAYKDIDAVMKAQADLVEIVHTLTQVGGVNVKG